MREHHIAVHRTARFWTLGQPANTLRQVWLVCHGYGQLAQRFLKRFSVLDDGERMIIAPEALSRFYLDGGNGPHGPNSRIGATWMTREDRLNEIADYTSYLDRLYDHVFADVARKTVELIALGFSQGVATAARWANRTDRPVDRLVLWAGTIPPEMELGPAAFGHARLTVVLGESDPFAKERTIHAEMARLDAAGLNYELWTFAGGHDLDDHVLIRLAADATGKDNP